MNSCECGCGAEVNRRFVRGHHWRTITAEEKAARFLARWDKGGSDGHWLWTGPQDGKGYGMTSFTLGPSRVRQSHRVIYELLRGPVPKGLQLDHLCRVRLCGNPDHLEPVTARENLLRGETWAAMNAAKTHCPYGHPYDEANTRWTKKRTRCCRTCERDRARASRGNLNPAPPTGERTHCPSGHPYDEENTRWYDGRRYCRACSRKGQRKTAGRRS